MPPASCAKLWLLLASRCAVLFYPAASKESHPIVSIMIRTTMQGMQWCVVRPLDQSTGTTGHPSSIQMVTLPHALCSSPQQCFNSKVSLVNIKCPIAPARMMLKAPHRSQESSVPSSVPNEMSTLGENLYKTTLSTHAHPDSLCSSELGSSCFLETVNASRQFLRQAPTQDTVVAETIPAIVFRTLAIIAPFS